MTTHAPGHPAAELGSLHRTSPPAPSAAAISDALDAAGTAAAAADVTVRSLDDVHDLQLVRRLVDEVWGFDLPSPPVTVEMMRALSVSGNYVVGAFRGEDLLGACVAFFGEPRFPTLHSHVGAVAAGVRGRSIGFAIKTHQRAWALSRGVATISWTFDPLLRRNAHFNIAKIGALPLSYLPDFYGPMTDLINRGERSDRLLVGWDLLSAAVTRACHGHRLQVDPLELLDAGAAVALDRDADGGPLVLDLDGVLLGRSVLVGVPVDIEQQRQTANGRAGAWRDAVRAVLGTLMADGGRVTGFAQAGWYVVDRRGDR